MTKTQVPKQRRLFVVMDDQMHEGLRAASARDGRTMSNLVRLLVRNYLESCGAVAPSPQAGRPAPPTDHEQA